MLVTKHATCIQLKVSLEENIGKLCHFFISVSKSATNQIFYDFGVNMYVRLVYDQQIFCFPLGNKEVGACH